MRAISSLIIKIITKIFIRSRRIFWKPSDIFICSYPKAGVSYLSFILSNLYIIRYMPLKKAVNYHTVDEFIPDIHSPLFSGNSLTEPNLIKTHENAYQFKDRVNTLGSGLMLPRVILLTRNPEKCVPSYYNYLKMMGTLKTNNFKNFSTYLQNIGREFFFWESSWMEYIKSNHKSCIEVNYEELIESPVTAISRICKFIGWDVSDSLILKAINLSSRNNMKKYAENFGDGMVYTQEFSFASERKPGMDEDIAYKKIQKYLNSKKI